MRAYTNSDILHPTNKIKGGYIVYYCYCPQEPIARCREYPEGWDKALDEDYEPAPITCTQEQLDLISVHEAILHNASAGNYYTDIEIPIATSLMQSAPIGTPVFDALYNCARYVMNKQSIVRIYDRIRVDKTRGRRGSR